MNENTFVTDYYALTAYLELNGLKYIKTIYKKDNSGKLKAFFHFNDPENIGKDLEMDFRFSPEKKYKDLLHFFRNEMEKAKV